MARIWRFSWLRFTASLATFLLTTMPMRGGSCCLVGVNQRLSLKNLLLKRSPFK